MPTMVFKYRIPNDNKSLNGSGTSLNLGSNFTVTGSGHVGRITAVTCSYPVMASSHRYSAQFQVTLSNTNVASSYTSNVIIKSLEGNGYTADIINTWHTLPTPVIFNNISNTTVKIQQTASVNDIYLRYKDSSTAFYVTITVEYEEGPQASIYTSNGMMTMTPYIYHNGVWTTAVPHIYDGTEWV